METYSDVITATHLEAYRAICELPRDVCGLIVGSMENWLVLREERRLAVVYARCTPSCWAFTIQEPLRALDLALIHNSEAVRQLVDIHYWLRAHGMRPYDELLVRACALGSTLAFLVQHLRNESNAKNAMAFIRCRPWPLSIAASWYDFNSHIQLLHPSRVALSGDNVWRVADRMLMDLRGEAQALYADELTAHIVASGGSVEEFCNWVEKQTARRYHTLMHVF